MCNTTFSYVSETILTLQPGFGQIWDAPGSDGGPIETVAVIWPLRDLICVCSSSSLSNVHSFDVCNLYKDQNPDHLSKASL
jgi:hypothetical protein